MWWQSKAGNKPSHSECETWAYSTWPLHWISCVWVSNFK